MCRFLASQASLKSLNLRHAGVPFSIVLDYMRRNLRTLTRLTWVLDLPESGKRVPFSSAELETIRDSCPDLEAISMFLPVEDLDTVRFTRSGVGRMTFTEVTLVNLSNTSNPQII